jgi:hypothetical protein
MLPAEFIGFSLSLSLCVLEQCVLQQWLQGDYGSSCIPVLRFLGIVISVWLKIVGFLVSNLGAEAMLCSVS